MISGLIGKKLGMTRIFDKNGNVIPVTLLEVGPCTITQIKKKDGKDKYSAVQVGFQAAKMEKANKPMAGKFKKAGVKSAFKVLREFRTEQLGDLKVGDELTADMIFKENSKVKVVGTSFGRGFTGAMKRHGFSGSGDSHGQEKVHRRPMSGGATDAQRVFRGKRGPGHMGDVRATVRNLELVRIKAFGEETPAPVEEPEKEVLEQAAETQVAEGEAAARKEEKKKKEAKAYKARKYIVAVKGAVPGKANSLVIIENT
jgi:large subunit ribosomal protein L3